MKQLLLFTSLQSFLFVLPQCGHFNDFAPALISHCSISAFILVWFHFFLFWLTWAFFWDSYRCTPASLPALSVHITAKETKENIYFQTRHHFHSAAWAPSIAELLWSPSVGQEVQLSLPSRANVTWHGCGQHAVQNRRSSFIYSLCLYQTLNGENTPSSQIPSTN